MQPYTHVVVASKEHVLVHKVGKRHWTAIGPCGKLVTVDGTDCTVIDPKMPTPIFCLINPDGMQTVRLDDMYRQIFEYGWTCGVAMQDDNVWQWDILSLTWTLNGLPLRMAIITSSGKALLSPALATASACRQTKLCTNGHWNTKKARKCQHVDCPCSFITKGKKKE